MDTLTFIAHLIDSLAWPVVLAFALVIVRKELPRIIQSVKKVRYKDFELEFGESARGLEQEAQATIPTPATEDGTSKVLDARADVMRRAGAAPRAEIIQAWLYVETAALAALKKKGTVSFTSSPGPQRLGQYLRKADLLNPDQFAVFEQLRYLRNLAVHVPDAEIARDAVESYVNSALALGVYLDQKASAL